jgi:hypothetical protein
MEIKVLKTFEISDAQWTDISNGFNTAFNQTKTLSQLKEYYFSTVRGYSYHALAINEAGRIIGSNVITPMEYNESLVFGYSGGTYILKEYRNDISLLRSMLTSLERYCSGEGISAFLAVPNKNSLTYFLRIARYKQIDTLRYHALPVRISSLLKRKFGLMFDIISIPFSWFLVGLNYFLSLLINPVARSVIFELSYNKEFYQKRFFQDHYMHIEKGKFECYFRVRVEGGVKTAYILDFSYKGKRSLRALATSVFYVLTNTKSELILFIGHLRLFQCLLFKVPSRMEPQPLTLVYKLTDPSYNHLDESLALADNWNFSLINFDAR